jgi:(p)ppGpp synthase/HD superfamily hydrolase
MNKLDERLKMNAILLGKMIALAAENHKDQFDKQGRPYVMHCMKVMHYLPRDVDDEIRQIAVGHDLFEDTKVTAQQLRDMGFSERVIAGIYALTKHRGQSYEEYKIAVKANPDAVIVKKADLRHNSDIRRIKDPGQKDFERVAKYRQFYTELCGSDEI